MNIKRTIDKNHKLIIQILIIIIFALFIIKSFNSFYEEKENKRKRESAEKAASSQIVETPENTPNYYGVESNSIEKTMRSFVKYCNNREINNAYKMLTEECKNAMFPTVEDFEKIYINNIYNVEREYELLKWSTDGNIETYQVTLYGNILATGNSNSYTQEFCTFIKDSKGNYKLNINNYICGEDRNVQETQNNITIKIGHIDIYEEYEEAQITIANNTSKTILLTGDRYKKNIYLQNSKDTTYSSLNSKFDKEQIVLKPNSFQSITVKFNKGYSISNKAQYLVLSDVILDYEDYLNSEDKSNYENRTSIKVKYQK